MSVTIKSVLLKSSDGCNDLTAVCGFGYGLAVSFACLGAQMVRGIRRHPRNMYQIPKKKTFVLNIPETTKCKIVKIMLVRIHMKMCIFLGQWFAGRMRNYSV